MPHAFSIGIQSRFRTGQSRFVIFLALNHCFVDLDARTEAWSCCKSPSKVYVKVVRNFKNCLLCHLIRISSSKIQEKSFHCGRIPNRTFILMFATDLETFRRSCMLVQKNIQDHLGSIIFVTLSHSSVYDICCRTQLSLACLWSYYKHD